MKFFLTLIIVLVSNTIFADNLTFRINHHGNIVNQDDLNRNEVFFQEVEFNEELEFSSELLKEIGNKSKELNQRLTFHPGPYNCLGSPHEDVINHTICDLQYHANLFDLISLIS